MVCHLFDGKLENRQTGYMQRKLIKSFEDIMVKYDGTVRNANNSVVQYIYGDSGADTITQFDYEIAILEMNNEQIKKLTNSQNRNLRTFLDLVRKTIKRYTKI